MSRRRTSSIRSWAACVCVACLIAAGARPAAAGGDAPEKLRHFELRVRPLLVKKCQKCHGPDKQEGGLRVDSIAALREGGESGPAVVAGKPSESLLMEAVRYESLEMPPKEQLSSSLIADLERWIRDGAVWPDVEVAPRTAPHKFTAEERAYWAFQPITSPGIPTPGDTAWCRNPIDAFVSARLGAAGLRPAPAADRATLVRRVYLDALGLQPSWAEVEAFVDDPADDDTAWARLVDRVLASPHFGERMAQRWLDVVRYADSDGYKADGFRPNAFRYRDYVIRAFNEDKPFDRFVMEQLAGDEIAPHDAAARAATGFWRLGLYEYNQRDARFHWSLIMDDMTDVIGESFLGLSMACAKCHDHKFDPILRKDYYRLQAFLAPLLWNDDVAYATPDELEKYGQARQAWEKRTAEARAELEKLEAPILASLSKAAVTQFPEDIQAVYVKPRAKRDWLEDQLCYLVERQAVDRHKELEKKLKGEQKKKWEELRKQVAAGRPQPLPTVMSVMDSTVRPATTRIPGSDIAVQPGFLSILDASSAVITPVAGSTGRRKALAEWIVSADNPLPARVLANRIWQVYFGRGIVESPNEFGRMGEPPTHPQLLDWLAFRLLYSPEPWRMKSIHRLILTSATYRQSAFHPDAPRQSEIDGDNRLYWHAPVRRLEAEQMRDSILQAARILATSVTGPSVEEKVPRRSLYVRKMRNSPNPWLTAFDAPTGFVSTAVRDQTTTPLQTLLLWNNDRILDIAKQVAIRASAVSDGTAESQVDSACRLLLAANADPVWRAQLIDYLRSHGDEGKTQDGDSGEDAPSLDALTDICHVLLNSNAFLYRE